MAIPSSRGPQRPVRPSGIPVNRPSGQDSRGMQSSIQNDRSVQRYPSQPDQPVSPAERRIPSGSSPVSSPYESGDRSYDSGRAPEGNARSMSSEYDFDGAQIRNREGRDRIGPQPSMSRQNPVRNPYDDVDPFSSMDDTERVEADRRDLEARSSGRFSRQGYDQGQDPERYDSDRYYPAEEDGREDFRARDYDGRGYPEESYSDYGYGDNRGQYDERYEGASAGRREPRENPRANSSYRENRPRDEHNGTYDEYDFSGSYDDIDGYPGDYDESYRPSEYEYATEKDSSSAYHEPRDDYQDEPEPVIEAPVQKKKAKKSKRGKKDQNNQDVFVDEEKLQLKPFGNRKVKESDFDRRKNQRNGKIIARGVVVSLIAVLVGIGGYQAIFPEKPLTQDEVASIAASSTGQTNFPLSRGEAFATEFVRAYLSAGGSNDESILGYFYSGTMTSSGDLGNRELTNGYNQIVVSGPVIYSSKAVSDSSAFFTVGALTSASVVDSNGNVVKTASTSKDGVIQEDGTQPQWTFFNVNVFYDKKTDKMFVTQDSPSVMPPEEIGSPSDLKKAAPVGNGEVNEDIKPKVSSTVYGFIKAYASSSYINHTDLDQYVVNNPEPSLINGLNGSYYVDGDMETALSYDVYNTDDPKVVKVLVTVPWTRKIEISEGSESKATYKSTYVMTLDNSSGKWLVSKFSPFVYTPDESQS